MKRKLALLLAALLALSLLAGCAGTGDLVSGLGTAPAPLVSLVNPLPSVKELQEGFFRTVAACQPGTAGASLKQARAACAALSFAQSRSLFTAESSLLREKLQQAWDGLEQEERDAFDGSFAGLCCLLLDCFDDWETQRPLFEDAGAAETMDQLLTEKNVRADWMALVSYTFVLERSGEEPGNDASMPAPPSMLQPPSPTPPPAPEPQAVKVFFYEDEREEFTMQVGEVIKLKAVAYPVDQFVFAGFKWSVNDESVLKLTVSDDTRECEIQCLKHQPGGVTLTVECCGVSRDVKVYIKK